MKPIKFFLLLVLCAAIPQISPAERGTTYNTAWLHLKNLPLEEGERISGIEIFVLAGRVSVVRVPLQWSMGAGIPDNYLGIKVSGYASHGVSYINSGEDFGPLVMMEGYSKSEPGQKDPFNGTMDVEHPDRDTVTRKIPLECFVVVQRRLISKAIESE